MSARGVRERIQPPRANLRFAATTTDSNESRPCTRNAMRATLTNRAARRARRARAAGRRTARACAVVIERARLRMRNRRIERVRRARHAAHGIERPHRRIGPRRRQTVGGQRTVRAQIRVPVGAAAFGFGQQTSRGVAAGRDARVGPRGVGRSCVRGLRRQPVAVDLQRPCVVRLERAACGRPRVARPVACGIAVASGTALDAEYVGDGRAVGERIARGRRGCGRGKRQCADGCGGQRKAERKSHRRSDPGDVQ